MYNDFTEIEKIYIRRFHIDTKKLSFDGRFELTECAYAWASSMSSECGFNVLKNKDRFVKYLGERVEWSALFWYDGRGEENNTASSEFYGKINF